MIFDISWKKVIDVNTKNYVWKKVGRKYLERRVYAIGMERDWMCVVAMHIGIGK